MSWQLSSELVRRAEFSQAYRTKLLPEAPLRNITNTSGTTGSRQLVIRRVLSNGRIAPSVDHVCRRLRLFRQQARECDLPCERLKSDVRSGRRSCHYSAP